ncbi:unnamed protein product [Caenorhabditis auriculariae]|uniref:TIL domain-containing protein n=1 Tax=Caenorhabditis auriculariae TaxID=2777116 RepID=A0A8S1GTW1_9PELO|nr:unnamed protein product [Caenorhabditis auriculariae]
MLKHVAILVIVLLEIGVHASAIQVASVAKKVTCETLKCEEKPGQVCFQTLDEDPKCVERKRNVEYCADKQCNMAMTCRDSEIGYICYATRYDVPGSCFNLVCDKKREVCVQKKGKSAKCVKIENAPKCEDKNEIYTDCEAGCDASCKDPEPVCDQYVCNTGCKCRKGFARINGTCQTFDKCPKSELGMGICQPNEYFTYFPPSCSTNCRGEEICESITIWGATCTCRPGYKRNAFEECVHNTQCYKEICRRNEKWDKCKNCETTCDALGLRSCHSKYCYSGCRCLDDYVRDRNGNCVLMSNCS